MPRRSTAMNKPTYEKTALPAYPRGAVPEEPLPTPEPAPSDELEETDDDRVSNASEPRPPADS